MSTPEGDASNPYAPPRFETAPVDPPLVSEPAARAIVKSFRTNIHSLGSMWIGFGMIVLYMLAMLYSRNDLAPQSLQLVTTIVFSGCAVFFAIGVLSICKVLPAVYVGQAILYLLAFAGLGLADFAALGLANVAALRLLGFCVLGMILLKIVLGHYVLSSARRMRELGLPLSTRFAPAVADGELPHR